MKRLFTLALVIVVATMSFAAQYLISQKATTSGETIEYKGQTFIVDSTAFSSFTALLKVAMASSTIYVDGGVYNEAVTISTAGLTFLGNNAYCEKRASNRTLEETKLTNVITIAADNITFNGFTITGNGKMYEWNARSGKPVSGFKFLYNIVEASTVAKTSTDVAVLQFGHYAGNSEASDTQWYQRYKDFTIAHNTFTGSASNTANFVSLSGAFGTTTITDNTFKDGGTSIYLNNGQGRFNIKNNSFTSVGDTARLSHGSIYGEFCIAMRYCGNANTTDFYIQNNVFNKCQGQSSMYTLIRLFNGDKSNAIVPMVKTKLYMNYNIFKNKPCHSSRDYNYVYYSNDEYTGKDYIVDCRFNEFDNSELCIGTVYLPDEDVAGRVFASSMGEFNFASSAGTTADYFVSPCGTTIKSQTMKSTRVCQSFDIDEETDDMYFLQIDPNNGAAGYEPQTITRYYKKSDGTTGKQYMYLGNAAHGSNMAVCRINGTLYVFTGGNSETSKSTSRAICIFPFVSGATANLQKTSFTYNNKTYTIKQMTSGNGHTNQYPSIDKQNRLLCECSRSSNYMYFVIYDLDDAFNNLSDATKLKSIKIQKLTEAYSSSSNAYKSIDQGFMFWPFQGFTINGDYLYIAEGMGGTTNGLDGYTVVPDNGKNIPIVMLNAYNWRTESWSYRKPVMKSAIINMSHGEPEGWKLRRGSKGRTNMYLQIANGASGSRVNNVFEYVADIVNGYKYKVPSVTSTASATTLALSSTDGSAVSQSFTVSSDYLLGDQIITISGEDASCFTATIKNGTVWKKKSTITVTYTPNTLKTQHKAQVRVSSPGTSDIIISLTGDNTPPAPPAIVYYELNGGELPKAAEVPTNDSLWTVFKLYYQEYYGITRADQPITDVSTFAPSKMCEIMTKDDSEYKWLGDYITDVATAQGYTLTTDPTADGMEALWRWHVHSFFNCNKHDSWPNTADFSTAGKPEAWGASYQEVYGEAVTLPETITETYTLPTPIKQGYEFGGWYWEADFSGTSIVQLEVGANGILYAKWISKDGPTTYLDNYSTQKTNIVKVIDGGRIVIWCDNKCFDLTGKQIR